jgi:hypothetical protein
MHRVVAAQPLEVRMDLPGHVIQQLRPGGAQLRIHQLLGASEILDPGEAVVMAAIAHGRLLHLPRQPEPSVQANMNGAPNTGCSQ